MFFDDNLHLLFINLLSTRCLPGTPRARTEGKGTTSDTRTSSRRTGTHEHSTTQPRSHKTTHKHTHTHKHTQTHTQERKSGADTLGAEEYPYFGFIPDQKANILPTGKATTWANKHCAENTATATYNADKTEVTVEISGSKCDILTVGDFYILLTVEGLRFVKIADLERSHKFTWKLAHPEKQAVQYDMATKGIRVFAFIHDEVQTTYDALATAELFLQPEIGRYPDKLAMETNVAFMTKYAKIQPEMTKRAQTDPLPVNTSLIDTGDFLGVVRLDGLDPMLGWAMGSTTGHTTIAMRDEKTHELSICESTVNSSYWKVNGVQCTKYEAWITEAKEAGYNVVWAPLDPARRAKLNVTAMWEFFRENEGYNYGYHTLLFGWIDTEQNNYPCLPPDYKTCLTWNIVELLFAVGHKIAPKLTDQIVVQAYNHRIGTKGLIPEEVYMYAETKLNMTLSHLPTIVEQDSWRYETTRYFKPAVGRSMVCCVFVCSMWKAGGLFGDTDMNCEELTNMDDYSLDIFNRQLTGENRPEVCKQADPTNQLCQLVGPYTLNLNHFNEGKMYKAMDTKCPSWIPGVGQNYWGKGKKDGTC